MKAEMPNHPTADNRMERRLLLGDGGRIELQTGRGPTKAAADLLAVILGEVVRTVPQRKRGQESIDRILDAACVVMARTGSAEISIADVADAVSLTEKAVYRYFSRIEDVFAALVARYQSRNISLVQPFLLTMPPQQAAVFADFLTQYITDHYRHYLEYASSGIVKSAEIQKHFLKHYHIIRHETYWDMAKILEHKIELLSGEYASIAAIATGTAALFGVAKAHAVSYPDQLDTPATRARMVAAFLAVLTAAGEGAAT